MKKYIAGLKPLPEDSRDFKLGALYSLPKLSELPNYYLVGTNFKVKNQKDSDFCSAFSSTSVSEFQENQELSPEWVFAVGKMIEGDPDSWGMDLRTVAKVHTKYGAVPADQVKYSVDNKKPSFLRRIENYDDKLFDQALFHKKSTYARADEGQYDPFDNIRASLWKFREEKRACFTGLIWNWSVREKYLEYKSDNGEPHAVAIIGWIKQNDKDYLVLLNSYGDKAGNKGLFYVSREVINKYAKMYGAFMFMDISKEEAEEYLKYGRKVDGIKFSLLNKILELLNQLLGLTQKKSMSKLDKIVEKSLSYEGTDFTPDWITPDDVSCAFSVTTLLKEIDPEIPIITGTWTLDHYLRNSPKFTRPTVPEAGCIVISPTGSGNGTIIGHTGIYIDKENIMSNDSFTGLWQKNYTRESWRNRYYYKGGFPVRLYKLAK